MTIFGPDVDLAHASYVHPSAQLHGKITAQHGVSIWANAVVRAEGNEVALGPYCNVRLRRKHLRGCLQLARPPLHRAWSADRRELSHRNWGGCDGRLYCRKQYGGGE